ncbi:MAG: hypothetical protein JWN46_84 [Acidimicrobiales bacterium]|nr:hypothetical protein [Acidimicrobiales bacterium]
MALHSIFNGYSGINAALPVTGQGRGFKAHLAAIDAAGRTRRDAIAASVESLLASVQTLALEDAQIASDLIAAHAEAAKVRGDASPPPGHSDVSVVRTPQGRSLAADTTDAFLANVLGHGTVPGPNDLAVKFGLLVNSDIRTFLVNGT